MSQNMSTISITCPHCHKNTKSFKSMMQPFVMFIVVGAGMQRQRLNACPGCMRRLLTFHALFNIISANILWPFLVLPFYVINLIGTFEEGHSQYVFDNYLRQLMRPPTPSMPNASVWTTPTSSKPRESIGSRLGDLSK